MSGGSDDLKSILNVDLKLILNADLKLILTADLKLILSADRKVILNADLKNAGGYVPDYTVVRGHIESSTHT